MVENTSPEDTLSDKQRQYLNGQLRRGELSDSHEYKIESKIRGKMFLAMRTIATSLSKIHDLNLSKNKSTNIQEPGELRLLLVQIVAFTWRVAQDMSGEEPEELIEKGVKTGSLNPFLKSVSVELEYHDKLELTPIANQLENGQLPDPWEIGAFIQSEKAKQQIPDCDETYLERLVKLSKESDHDFVEIV